MRRKIQVLRVQKSMIRNRSPEMILISACLLGEDCRYDAGNSLNKELLALLKGKELLPICPEVAGGLPIPRPPAEIKGGDGRDVLTGKAKVKTAEDDDFTDFFIKGARKILEDLDLKQIDFAILKSRSPSCGVNQIYNGQFNGQLKEGPGVTAAYLKSKGVSIFSEEELEKIKRKLKE